MSDLDIMHNLAKTTAEMSEKMSVEQIRLFQAYVTKTLEAKEAAEAFIAAAELEANPDEVNRETLQEIRGILADMKYRLSGTECVLLAGYIKQLEGEDYTDTKRINILLHFYDRKPSNSTKIVDTLEKKRFMEIQSDGLHAHKTYRLTHSGEAQAKSLLAQLRQSGGRDHLAVVD